LLVLVALMVGFLKGVHPFLAVTDKVDAEYLVAEGWISNYALEESIQEFNSRPYRLLLTTGGQTLNGTNVEPGDSDAEEAYKRLKWMGFKPELMRMAPSGATYRHRTYSSAVALRKWAETNQLNLNAINVVTEGTHARRSRLLFEKAFKGKIKVGIIAVENREYDPRRWWQFSEGVKEVLSEGAAYFYVRFFFKPPQEAEKQAGNSQHANKGK
jgi:hypothetical protein